MPIMDAEFESTAIERETFEKTFIKLSKDVLTIDLAQWMLVE